MSKRELLSESLANVRESMGDFGGVVPRAPGPGPRPLPAHLQGVTRSKDVSQIEVDRIVRDPDQPREEFDQEALARLAESLKNRGQLQPIRVRWDEGKGAYMVVVGERRWRAAAMAGLASLSCVIVEGPMPPDEVLAVQMIENAVREDLKPIEQANAYRRLIDAKGWSARQLAGELSIHHAQVVRALALLDLPAEVQASVEKGDLSPATAYEVSKVEDPAVQAEVAAQVMAEKLSRAETVEVVRKVAEKKPARATVSKGRGEAKAKVKLPSERSLRTATGLKVTVAGRKGFDVLTWADALEDAARQVRARLEPAEGRPEGLDAA
jgi:ParB family transcriptional regulator, chromosome partitioning protein